MLWLWLILACLGLLIVVPPVVAIVETWAGRSGPADVGFFTLARAVAGTCHVPWGRRGSPVVRFPLPFAEGRARVLRGIGGPACTLEVRAYQQRSFGFSARVASPPTPPARWHAPGLAPMSLESDATEALGFCSLEATDERLLRWLLRHPETRQRIDSLQLDTNAEAVEIVLAGRLILVRAHAPRGIEPGGIMESMALPTIEALRLLSDDLHDLACALEDAGEPMNLSVQCRGCGTRLGADPWVCPGCGHAMHRGCREMTGGCADAACDRAPDAVPAVLA
jgi:hypothetical protein